MKINIGIILIKGNWKITCQEDNIYLSHNECVLIDNLDDFLTMRRATRRFIVHSNMNSFIELLGSNQKQIIISEEELLELHELMNSFEKQTKFLCGLTSTQKCIYTPENVLEHQNFIGKTPFGLFLN